jgi:hypothetical protein
MSALLWLLVPVGFTLLAIGWVMLRSREPRPASPDDGIETLRRMHEAMNRPLPGQTQAKSGGGDAA